MSLIARGRRKALLWDFICVDTFAVSHLDKFSRIAGGVASRAEYCKFEKYSNLKDLFHFVPVTIETLGTFGEEATELLKHIGRRITYETGEKIATSYIFQRVGIAERDYIHNGNSSYITKIGTALSIPSLEEKLHREFIKKR